MSERAVDRAYGVIRDAILGGEFEEGFRLREEELAATVGVSRTPVREALGRLYSDGLVDFEPNRGARVVSHTREDLVDIYNLRALLESHAAALAAERIDDVAVEHLRELAEAMEQVVETRPADSRDEIATLNRDFHSTIVKAADSPRLSNLLSSVVLVPLVHRAFHYYSAEDLDRTMKHHRELIAAMAHRDPQWAKAVMRSHVHAARAVLVRAAP